MSLTPKKEATMKSKSVYAFILYAFASVCLAQVPGNSAFQANQAQLPSGPRETDSQLTLNALVLKLNRSLQAISEARDSQGYVQDESLLKTHSAILCSLKNTIRGKRGKTLVVSSSQRSELEAAVRALNESFDQFLLAHDKQTNSEVYVYMDVKEAYSAHDTALKRLNQMLKDIGLFA